LNELDKGKGDAESRKGRPVERKASTEHFWNEAMVWGGVEMEEIACRGE